MPHLFANRPRLLHLAEDGDPGMRFRWETANAFLYKLGGLTFVAGSVLFFPRFSAYEDAGAWLFFAGSLIYLVVTGHDLAEVMQIRSRRGGKPPDHCERLEEIAAPAYVAGTVLFAVGSLFFLSSVGLVEAGAMMFVVGSLLFVLGATMNVMQVQDRDTPLARRLMNYTAITFVVGSVLFTVASVPYLWDIRSPEDRRTLHAFLAWQYLVGSGLFLAGGVFNYWRAWDYATREIAASGGRGG